MEQRSGHRSQAPARTGRSLPFYFVFTQRPEDHVIPTLVGQDGDHPQELGSLSPVLERRIEDLFAEGLKPSLAATIEMLDAGASGCKAQLARTMSEARVCRNRCSFALVTLVACR